MVYRSSGKVKHRGLIFSIPSGLHYNWWWRHTDPSTANAHPALAHPIISIFRPAGWPGTVADWRHQLPDVVKHFRIVRILEGGEILFDLVFGGHTDHRGGNRREIEAIAQSKSGGRDMAALQKIDRRFRGRKDIGGSWMPGWRPLLGPDTHVQW